MTRGPAGAGTFHRYAGFLLFLAVLFVGSIAVSLVVDATRALLIGFDAGALIYLLRLIRLFGRADAAAMRARAAANAPDHRWIVIIATVIVAVVLAALATEFSGMGRDPADIGLAAATLSLAWLFANAIMALHYAQLWYTADGDEDARGLAFPDHKGEAVDPDYWDFAYFSFTVAMTFQVSDIAITTSAMRRTALLHGMVAFLYNIAIVALSVSLLAAALGG